MRLWLQKISHLECQFMILNNNPSSMDGMMYASRHLMINIYEDGFIIQLSRITKVLFSLSNIAKIWNSLTLELQIATDQRHPKIGFNASFVTVMDDDFFPLFKGRDCSLTGKTLSCHWSKTPTTYVLLNSSVVKLLLSLLWRSRLHSGCGLCWAAFWGNNSSSSFFSASIVIIASKSSLKLCESLRGDERKLIIV